MLAVVLYAVALPVWSRVVESARAAKDRLVTTLVWTAFAIALVPLVSLVFTVLKNGLGVINGEFLTYSMRNVIGAGGGIYHAILGTLLVTLAAAGHLGADRPAHRDLPRRVRPHAAASRARSRSSST